MSDSHSTHRDSERLSEMDVLRLQAKRGMNPRDMVIDSYRREWATDPDAARKRLAKWEGTPTGDNIIEGGKRAGVLR